MRIRKGTVLHFNEAHRLPIIDQTDEGMFTVDIVVDRGERAIVRDTKPFGATRLGFVSVEIFVEGLKGTSSATNVIVNVPRSYVQKDVDDKEIKLFDMVVATRPLRLSVQSGKPLPGLHRDIPGFIVEIYSDQSMKVLFKWGSRFCAEATVRAGSLRKI